MRIVRLGVGSLVWFGLCLHTLSCAGSGLTRSGYAGNLPSVSGVAPTLSAGDLADLSWIELSFSRAVWAESVTTESIFLVMAAEWENYTMLEWQDLRDDVAGGDVAVVAISVTVADDGLSAAVVFAEGLQPATEYTLIVTPDVLSIDRLPLDQAPGGNAHLPYTVSFTMADTVADDLADTSSSASTASNSSDTTSTSDSTTTADASVAVATEEGDGATSEEDATASAVESETASDEEAFDSARVLISEVVTDPQSDHDESSGGNGVKFDATPGSGAVSTTDEYVEIYNGTDAAIDLTGYDLSMKDGTDALQGLDTDFISFFSLSGDLTDFAPGEFLVLGNPSGQINNNITIELLDATAAAVDTLTIEDANASDPADEAYTLDLDSGEWGMTAATPGY